MTNIVENFTILESLKDVAVVSSLEGKVIFANAAAKEFFGYVPTTLSGDTEQINKFLKMLAAGAVVDGYESTASGKDNKNIDVFVSLSVIKNNDGQINGVLQVTRNITTQKAAIRDLEEFAYVASHDLQEQLRNIINYAGLLNAYTDAVEDEEFGFFLKVITDSSKSMSVLITELLQYSRIGKNRIVHPVNCGQILVTILKELEDEIRETGAVITIDDLPVIKTDTSEIKQVFKQLIENALRFRDKNKKPEIHVSCEQKADKWMFSVSDNGIGFNEAFRDKIFVVFKRLHPAGEYPGAGVGLAICKKIVALNGGNMYVNSKPGSGSIFWFTIRT